MGLSWCILWLSCVLESSPCPPASKEGAIEVRLVFSQKYEVKQLRVVDLFGDRNSEGVTTLRNGAGTSPEKEDRYYATRGSSAAVVVDENGRISTNSNGNGNGNTKAEERGFVWPKLLIALSSKEKEEDFMAMKGCKLPQRPKKRAKMIQRSLLLVSPGAWLNEMSQERYEVREKKSSKKAQRPTGLKAMGSMESDSE